MNTDGVTTFDEKLAQEELENGYEEAERILNDPDKIEKLLQRLEKKLKVIPVAGDALAIIPIMISLVRNYVKKEYTDVPLGSILAIISTTIYVVSQLDLIPDFIPIAGYLDDLAVISACLKLVKTDLDEYIKWREKNGMASDID